MARRERHPDDAARAFAIAVAAFGPLLVAGILVPFRDDLASANIVLVFVLVVVCGAAIGTRGSGAFTAVVAAMSFDFFFTRPYQSLKIDDSGRHRDDVPPARDRPRRRRDRHLLTSAPGGVRHPW